MDRGGSQGLGRPGAPSPAPALSSSCSGPHHDLGWHEALSVAGYSLQALLSLPVQVLESLTQGAMGALQVTTWRAGRATRLRTIWSTTRPGCNPRDGQGTEPASRVPEGPPGQRETQGRYESQAEGKPGCCHQLEAAWQGRLWALGQVSAPARCAWRLGQGEIRYCRSPALGAPGRVAREPWPLVTPTQKTGGIRAPSSAR